MKLAADIEFTGSKPSLLRWLYPVVLLAFISAWVPGFPEAGKFLLAVVGFIPLAKTIVDATETLAQHTGPTVGAILSATFGNAPEMIIALVALHQGMFDVVRASIVGVILGNLLFVVGLSFLIGGLNRTEQKYNRRGAMMHRSILMIAAISIIMPSLFDNFISPETLGQEMAFNTGVAVVLLITYGLSLIFMLKTHPHHFSLESWKPEDQTTEKSAAFGAIAKLALSSASLAMLSEIIMGSVEQTAHSLGLSRAFIGMIILALIGGAPESLAAISMAKRDKLDMTMGIAVGSSVQMSLFVAPMIMLASYFIAPAPFDLIMGNAAITLLLLTVLIFSMLVPDGQSNWFKGVQLLSVYMLIALFCFYLPDSQLTPLISH
jgi:Ca2+:H+ antiporter